MGMKGANFQNMNYFPPPKLISNTPLDLMLAINVRYLLTILAVGIGDT